MSLQQNFLVHLETEMLRVKLQETSIRVQHHRGVLSALDLHVLLPLLPSANPRLHPPNPLHPGFCLLSSDHGVCHHEVNSGVPVVFFHFVRRRHPLSYSLTYRHEVPHFRRLAFLGV